MTGPNFILIGAMKCGTSTLATQLGSLGGVFMTDPKEPNFFSDDEVYKKGTDWYQALFSGAATGDICGEASTHYTKRPDYPNTLDRLQKGCSPELRLVYMIRNPMARLVSHYIHAWSEGELSTPLSEAIDQDTRLTDYGRFGWQIEPYVQAFGTKAILLTSLERLRLEPDAELQRIAEHIGFQGDVVWDDDVGAQNVSAKRTRKLPMHSLIIDNPVARSLRRALVPKAIRTKIREGRQMSDRPEIPTDAKPELERLFLQDRDRLAGFFPDDPSLDLAYPFAS